MTAPLPERVEATIRAAEERLTRELRELTGRDDLKVVFDREQFAGVPEPERLPDDYWETAN